MLLFPEIPANLFLICNNQGKKLLQKVFILISSHTIRWKNGRIICFPLCVVILKYIYKISVAYTTKERFLSPNHLI